MEKKPHKTNLVLSSPNSIVKIKHLSAPQEPLAFPETVPVPWRVPRSWRPCRKLSLGELVRENIAPYTCCGRSRDPTASPRSSWCLWGLGRRALPTSEGGEAVTAEERVTQPGVLDPGFLLRVSTQLRAPAHLCSFGVQCGLHKPGLAVRWNLTVKEHSAVPLGLRPL